MLHINHSFNFHLPHMTSLRPLELSPIVSEEDELIQDIERSVEQPWELVETPDADGINQFWSGVEDDLRNDPTWFNFANE